MKLFRVKATCQPGRISIPIVELLIAAETEGIALRKLARNGFIAFNKMELEAVTEQREKLYNQRRFIP